jgi:uncharacterized iron-regulated membrane protein
MSKEIIKDSIRNLKRKGKKLAGQLHLWLGLASGLVVFIVSVTGCLYVFRDEISLLTADAPVRVHTRNMPYLPPSRLMGLAEKYLPGKQPNGIRLERGKALSMNFFGEGYSYELLLDPYTGKLIKATDYKKREGEFNFFGFVLDGHLNLWLPYKIGRPIVDYSILVFVITLITGLILWWPKKWNKYNREKSFRVKWTATFKRLNYDLHNVLGFYALLVLLVIASTGLVWAFGWFQQSLYWLTSGGRSAPQWINVASDTTFAGTPAVQPADKIWNRLWENNHQMKSIYMGFPRERADAFFVNINPRSGTLYRQDIYYFDRYTLKEIYGGGVYSQKRYAKASVADKINRMNYDLHVGQLLGLPGKILAFFASLISASLPVTGFLVWWGRRKKKKPVRRTAAKQTTASL